MTDTPAASKGVRVESAAISGSVGRQVDTRARAYELNRSSANISRHVYEAFNPEQRYAAFFLQDGVELRSRTANGIQWSLGMTLNEIGRARAMRAVTRGAIAVSSNRIAYDRSGLVEWYENRPEGIEQGFTFPKRLAGTGEIRLDLALHGDVTVRLESTGSVAADFRGVPVLRYSKLLVTDAAGLVLPSRFELKGSRLRIVFSDVRARYPVTVDPLFETPNWQTIGRSGFQELGRSVAAGDVNGDGFSDVIVGSSSGLVAVHLGTSTGLRSLADWSAQGSSTEAFGSAVAGAGDINGDGFGDIIVGSPAFVTTCTSTGVRRGRAYVWFGGASAAADVTGLGPPGTPGNADLILNPPQVNDFCGPTGMGFGTLVGGAGDVNGDGFGDVFVSDPHRFLETFFPDTQPGFGEVDVYLGSRTGLALNRRLRAATPDRCLPEDSGGDGPDRCRSVRFGATVAAGDINGDGKSDLVVAAAPSTVQWDDHVHIYPGTSSGLDGDPSLGLLDRSIASLAVANVNRDCCDDLVLTTRYAVEFGTVDRLNPGFLEVYNGTPTGVHADADERHSPFSVTYSTSSGTRSAFIEAFSTVAAAGDVNADGFVDLAVGTYLPFGFPRCDQFSVSDVLPGCNPDFGGIRAGQAFGSDSVQAPATERVYLLHGAATGLTAPPATILSRPAGFSCSSSAHDMCFGSSLSGAGDVNGDGFADVVGGGHGLTPRDSRGFEISSLQRAGAAFAYHGFGLGLTPVRLDFGALSVGTTSAELTSTLFNGGRAVTLSGVLEGAHPGDFTLVNGCQGRRLEPGDRCSITGRYRPTRAGTATASVRVTATETGEQLSSS